MHIHANLTNPNMANLYAAEAAEKAAAARQAAEVRKKLLQNASKLSSEPQVRELSRNDQDSQQEAGSDQGKQQLASKKKHSTEAAKPSDPISMWA